MVAYPKDFSEALVSAGLEPHRVKLLRHDHRGLETWNRSPDHFLSFASVQDADASPFKRDPEYVAHFLPGPKLAGGGFAAYFVGVSRLYDRWPWDDERPPRCWVYDYRGRGVAAEAADQSWVELEGAIPLGLIVDWGLAPRSWHQWGTQKKPIIAGGNGLPDIGALVRDAGSTLMLTEEERAKELLGFEERDIKSAIERNPHEITRLFEDRRAGMVQVRPDQRAFRKALLSRYGSTCCITGCETEPALEAAHIIPFAEGTEQRNYLSNGLLLRRDVHRLFDLLLVSVHPETNEVWVGPELRSGHYGFLHGASLVADAARPALQEHFSRSQRQAGT